MFVCYLYTLIRLKLRTVCQKIQSREKKSLSQRKGKYLSFWLYWVFVAANRLSLAAVSLGFSPRWVFVAEHRLYSTLALAQQLWCVGLIVPRHVESAQTRDRTHVPCIGRWILNHYL